VGVMRARGLRCFRGSRVARNLHFSLLSFRFHRHPPGTDSLEPESFRTARKHSASRESFRSCSHGGVCVCIRVRMYVYNYRRCKDSPVIFASPSSSYFCFRSSICLAREGKANLLFGRSAFCIYILVYRGRTKIGLSAIGLVVKIGNNFSQL
jgi:hypothetical protein